jgi:hypothetical protein
MKFTNELYDLLKKIAQVWLPAAATLYFAVAAIWGLPDPNQVVGSITALDAFLGAVLTISSKTYVPPMDGHVLVDQTDPRNSTATVQVTTDPGTIPDKNVLTLKVLKITQDMMAQMGKSSVT